jgi:hypothetical protein
MLWTNGGSTLHAIYEDAGFGHPQRLITAKNLVGQTFVLDLQMKLD